jgi:hypothetical protein
MFRFDVNRDAAGCFSERPAKLIRNACSESLEAICGWADVWKGWIFS